MKQLEGLLTVLVGIVAGAYMSMGVESAILFVLIVVIATLSIVCLLSGIVFLIMKR